MSAVKTIVSKDWWKQKDEKKAIKKVSSFETLKVTAKEDLPTLITTKEAAGILRCHHKTVEELRNSGSLQFFKVMGRYFTTPEFIADYLQTEIKKNG